MEKYISVMPGWAIVLFVITFILSLGMIMAPARKAALGAGMTSGQAGKIQLGILVFYLLWLGYTSVMALSGVFDSNALPPRIMLFTTLPLMIILFGYVGNTALFKKLLKAASLESMIFLHVFRVEGIFFILLALYKVSLPQPFAISAGVGDLLTALLAIPVARSVAKNRSWSRKAVVAWNILGMADILTAITIATVNAITSHDPRGGEMTMFPFSFFPAFAPGTILFLHIAIFRKLRMTKKTA